METLQTPLIKKPVQIWLLIGLVMVFFQVVIGGVTRLTDSGLSITEWSVIQGTVPPLNEAEWQQAFEMYQQAAKKQFESLHADMTLSGFKVIFFWEYFHRLWARLMGFVFLFPFLYFLFKKWLPKWLVLRLVMVILLAALAAVFGWVMVDSGLNDDKRTWVSAYKLVVHLGIAATLFGYLYWTWLKASQPAPVDGQFTPLRRLFKLFAVVVFVQIAFGGLMSGMKAGLIHPHFPVFVEGERLWSALTSANLASSQEILDYEPNRFAKACVQVLHRATAWVLVILVFLFYKKATRLKVSDRFKKGVNWMMAMLVTQFILGISTVLHSIGKPPVALGSVHQAGALLLLITMLFVGYQLKRPKEF